MVENKEEIVAETAVVFDKEWLIKNAPGGKYYNESWEVFDDWYIDYLLWDAEW